MKKIYQASTEQEAEMELEAFEKWDGKSPTISQTWRRNWMRVIALFALILLLGVFLHGFLC